MPRQTEPNANNALGDMLRGMMPDCEVRSENTQTFIDHPGRHADVLIVAPGRSPVVVEAEYEPAVLTGGRWLLSYTHRTKCRNRPNTCEVRNTNKGW